MGHGETRESYTRLLSLDEALAEARRHAKVLNEDEAVDALIAVSEGISTRLTRSLEQFD